MKNKKNLIRTILIIMIIIHCIVIFNFSSQQADESSNTSGFIVNSIVEKVYEGKNVNEEEKEELRKKIIVPIRKTAHFSIYTFLGVLLISCLKTFEYSDKKKILISWTLGTVYAGTDEFHQLFVPGRSGEILDVCIDSLGVLFGIGVVIVAVELLKEKNTR